MFWAWVNGTQLRLHEMMGSELMLLILWLWLEWPLSRATRRPAHLLQFPACRLSLLNSPCILLSSLLGVLHCCIVSEPSALLDLLVGIFRAVAVNPWQLIHAAHWQTPPSLSFPWHCKGTFRPSSQALSLVLYVTSLWSLGGYCTRFCLVLP